MAIIRSFLNPSSRWYYLFHWSVLIVLGLTIYYQTFGFGFVFDDLVFIVNNSWIKSFDQVHYIWKTIPQTRTVGFYSFAFNYFIGQLHPQGYHIFNFLIHLLAVGLIWATAGALFQMSGQLPSTDWLRQEIPFIIAVLFLVHPCQTQAVTYISQRFESMATVFYIGSIYSYLCGRISSSKAHKIFLFTISIGLAILGIFTKEVAVTIPLMVLAVELTFFNGDHQGIIEPGKKSLKKSDFRKICIVLTVVGGIFFMLFIKLVRTDLNVFFDSHPFPSQSHDGDMITAKSYLLTQMRVFLTFMRLLVLPIQQNLDYDYPLSRGILHPPLTLIGMCLIGTIVFLFFKLRKKFPIVAFGLAWILITFSINLAPRVNVIFEHKLYLISFGFFLILVSVLFIIIRQRTLLVGLLIIMIAVLSLSSFLRNQVWKNQLTLWDDTVQKSSHKARPYFNRGNAYSDQGDFIQAVSDYNKAIEINPDYPEAYYNRGSIYYTQGNFTQALSDYNRAIEINPDYAEAYNNRGSIFARQGNFTQAIADFNKAIEIMPDYASAYINHGLVYEKQGNFTQALSDYNRAIEVNPDYAEAYDNRGIFYDKQGNFSQALLDFNKAIEISSDYAEAYYNRGNTCARQGNFTQALLDFNKAIDINPNYAKAYINRGNTYSRQGNFIQALSDYNKAIEINPNIAEAYNNRGNTYSRQGSFTQALSDYNKVIGINPNYKGINNNRAVIYYQLKEYDKAWADVHKAETLGDVVKPGFISVLKKASGGIK